MTLHFDHHCYILVKYIYFLGLFSSSLKLECLSDIDFVLYNTSIVPRHEITYILITNVSSTLLV
jgi:hypothetical protein